MSREYIKRLNSGYKKKRLEMISNDTQKKLFFAQMKEYLGFDASSYSDEF